MKNIIIDNVTKAQLRIKASKLQSDFELQKRRADIYGARLYDIEHPLSDPPPTLIEVKQENTFLKDQNSKLAHELSKYKNIARESRTVINSLKDLIIKVKNVEFHEGYETDE